MWFKSLIRIPARADAGMFAALWQSLHPMEACATGKGKAGLAVVYRFAVRLPANQRKVGAVVLGMAGHAILARGVRRKPGRVHTASLRHPLANLGMAIEASKLHLSAAEFMALRAVQRARERFMRFG